jgi:YggT family protein
MITLILFVSFVIHCLLQVVIWLIFASVVVSWLVAFDVINMRNRTANQIVRFIEGATRPILRPFRRVIPPLGNLDLTPMIVMILLLGIDDILRPALASWLISLTGGAAG